jgi:uncharacterized membrane protein YvlD (DUF360 family)
MIERMSPLAWALVKLGVRLVVFTAVFWIAAQKNKKIVFDKKWATPIIALTFAILNTALYWAVKPILNLATMGALAVAMPLVINGALLLATERIFQSRKWFRIDGVFAMVWMAIFLTVAHGALWVAIDYIPKHV